MSKVPGIYVRGDDREWTSNRTPMVYKIGCSEDVYANIKGYRRGETYPHTLFRVYRSAPGLARGEEKSLHDTLKLAGYHVRLEHYSVPLAVVDKLALGRPGLSLEFKWVHPKDDNYRWPRYVILAAFYYKLAYHPEYAGLPRAGARKLLPLLVEMFPLEMQPVLDKECNGGDPENCLIQRMDKKFRYPAEHPDTWKDREVYENVLMSYGWQHYPISALI